jgi:hypothetical protein
MQIQLMTRRALTIIKKRFITYSSFSEWRTLPMVKRFNVAGHYALKFNAVCSEKQTQFTLKVNLFSLLSHQPRNVSQHDVVQVSVNSHLF